MDFKVSTFLILAVSFLIFEAQVSSLNQTKEQKIRFCSVDNSLTFEWAAPARCPLLVSDMDHPVDCIIARDRVTCLRHLVNHETDFMSAEPEDLLVLAIDKEFNDKILVTSRLLQQADQENTMAQFTMGVVAHKNIENISQIKKKRFCSPGAHTNLLTQDFLKYFERRVIPPTCDPDKTLLENRISDLSQYFNSSCMNGLWTMDTKFDRKLKKKYRNLCSCKSPNHCFGTTFTGKADAMSCLLADRGDLAWTILENDEDSFEEYEYNAHYLCPDGTTRPLNQTEAPCSWLKIPWQTIITNADSTDKVMQFMRNNLYDIDVQILFMAKPVELEKFKTPTDYLQESFSEYYSTKDYHAKCKMQDRGVKWCVVTKLENEKCKWLSYSARAHGVEPLIECVQEISQEKCLKSVKNGWTDIFSIKPDQLSEAKKKGLKPLLHMIGSQVVGKNETAVIVQKSSNIKSLKDLKKGRACFGEYADYGWNSFIYMMKNLTDDKDWYCKDKKMVSDYFEKSCVGNLNEQNVSFPNNLYSLCPRVTEEFGKKKSNCSLVSRVRRQFVIEQPHDNEIEVCDSIDEAILNCLSDYDADVAFINLSSIIRKQSSDESHPLGFMGAYFQLLCVNESMAVHNEKPKMCFASWKNYGSLMVHENLTKTRKNEIYLLVLELDRLFRVDVQGMHKQISLYGPFGGQSNVIFSNETVLLEPIDCSQRCSLDYAEIYKHLSTIKETCDGMSLSESPPLIQFTTNLLIFNLFLIIILIISST